MGAKYSSCKENHYLSFLENKKITILEPTYLVLYKNKSENGYDYENIQKCRLLKKNPLNISDNCNMLDKELPSYPKNESTYEFIIKINCKISFFIKDIVEILNVIEGPRNYQIEPILLNKIKIKDIEILLASDIFNMLFDKKKFEYLNLKIFMYESFFNVDSGWIYFSRSKKKNEDKLKNFINDYKDIFLIEDL